MPTLQAVEEILGAGHTATPAPTCVDVDSDTVTAEDLIRSYVYQVHKDADAAASGDKRRRLEQLTADEKRLNASLKQSRTTTQQTHASFLSTWKQSAETAIEAFTSGQLLVFVGENQLRPGDGPTTVPAHKTVRFIRLLPLAGG